MFKFITSVKTSFILLAVVILLIFLHFTNVLLPIEGLVIKVISPIQHQVYILGTKFNDFYSGFSQAGNLEEKNYELQNEVRQLIIENSQLRTLIQETKEILIQESFLENTGYEAVSAKVVGKNPESSLQTLILNKGSKDGVREGQPIITADGVMVGKILQARSNSSEAILINDSRSKIAALIQNDSNSKGVVVGEHGLSLRMELIPQNEKVEEGNLVVTSGVESTIPKGLIIGKIIRIITEPNGYFQTAFLQPIIKIDNLTIVSILKAPAYDE